MRKCIKCVSFLVFMSFIMSGQILNAQRLADFKFNGPVDVTANQIRNNFQFNGYTNHWWNDYKKLTRYGNLFKISVPDVDKTIMQNKVDIAEDLQVPGLFMQEGFLAGWLDASPGTLENPSPAEIETAVRGGSVLAMIDPQSEAGKIIMPLYPGNDSWKQTLKSYQFNDPNLAVVDAFILENGNSRIFVIASGDKAARDKTKALMDNARDVVAKYDMHKGWFGVETLLKSVTCAPGHPIDLIGKGMNEGLDWFVFSGYMEFLGQDEYQTWVERSGMPIVLDLGHSPIYGLDDYSGLQVQDMPTKQSWIDFAKKKNGYIFRPVWDPASDAFHYDGYIASEGDKFQIDNNNVPFVTRTGGLLGGMENSMILFLGKGEKLTRETMWKAILDNREVAVMGKGVIMGPKVFRTAAQMLLLDRVFLEDYYGDKLDLQAVIDGYTLNLNITNTGSKAVTGKVNVRLPDGVVTDGLLSSSISVPAGASTTFKLDIRPDAQGMDKANPIVAGLEWDGKKKYTMCVLEMPPAISVHRLLYGHAPIVKYPVTIHNFSKTGTFPVTVKVFDRKKPGKALFSASQNASCPTGSFSTLDFNLKVPAGNFDVEVSALGVTTTTQLGVGKAAGSVHAYPLDLNADGVMEYRLENDSVQVTLLATGARVIEYIVKSRNDNVLFKLWPEKSGDDKRPNRSWGYYPYGGFEDFLGQASMETHTVFDAELIKESGDYVQVRMSTDYYGNKLQKIFTLYGNSPLLEVRYALTFQNPEANVLGPQPILEIGKVHGTEDVFITPTIGGNEEFRMRMEDYYGRALMIREGWNAGYDTKEDIAFVGAFPVSQPIFLHMWMNHPRNGDAHHYYVEFQPWTPIYQRSTMYFTYYLWGAGGSWEKSLDELRKRNLISTR